MPHSLHVGGCTFAEDPDRSAPDARLIWSGAFDPGVLRVGASIDTLLECLPELVTAVPARPIFAVRDSDHAHLAIGSTELALRLDTEVAVAAREGGEIGIVVELGPRFGGQLAALGQLLRLSRGNAILARAPRPDPRLQRLILALRALDALHAGATLRSIAEALLPEPLERWPGRGEADKSRVRRLVSLARQLERGGPAAVLSFLA